MSLGNKQIMANNIKRLLDKKGMNPRQMALALGLKYTTVNDWVNAKSYPRIDKVEMMANFFNVAKSDLVEEYPKPATPTKSAVETMTPLTATLDQLTDRNRQKVESYAINLLDQQEQTQIEEPQALYEVRTVSALAAGLGYGYDDNDISIKYVEDQPPRHDIASLVKGDSMLPDYETGDVVYLVDRGVSRYSGQVCAVVVDDETYIKKVYTEPDGLRLVSLNPDYADKFIDFPPSGDTHIKIFAVIGSAKPVAR